MSFFTYQEGSNVLNVNKEELKKILEDSKALEGRNLYLVDLRSEAEIKGTGLLSYQDIVALHIPMGEFGAALDMEEASFKAKYKVTKPNKENDVLIFSCAAGGRSAKASKLSASKGYKNVANYTGGSSDWFKK